MAVGPGARDGLPEQREYGARGRSRRERGAEVEGADVTDYEWATWPMARRVQEAKALLPSLK